jgi:ankyrin repeat protein
LILTKDDRTSALFIACNNGHTNCARALLDLPCVDCDLASEDDGETPLFAAAFNNHVEVVTLLCERGADVSLQTLDGLTALFVAVQNGHSETVEVLISWGADVEKAESSGEWTPLAVAASSGRRRCLEVLLDHGAKIDSVDPFEGESPVAIAAAEGFPDCVETLIKRGADVNICRFDGAAALHLAAEKGCEQSARLLLQAGADYTMRTEDDKTTALDIAITKKHKGIALLIKMWPVGKVQIAVKLAIKQMRREGYYERIEGRDTNELTKPLFIFKVLDMMISCEMQPLANHLVEFIGIGEDVLDLKGEM